MRRNVVIETYDTERVENPAPRGEVDPAQWMKIRNTLVTVCRKHGPTGPLGTFNFTALDRTGDFLEAWELGDDNPSYFIVTDQFNDIDRYHYIELTTAAALTKEWVNDIMDALLTFRGWGLGVSNINGGYMLIFANRVMITGSLTQPTVPADLETLISRTRDCLAVSFHEDS